MSDTVIELIVVGVVGLALLAWWLLKRKREARTTLVDPDLFRSAVFRLGVSGQTLQQIGLGGAMIVLPIFMQMVPEYNALQTGLTIAPLSLTMFGVALLAGKRAGRRRPSTLILAGFGSVAVGTILLIVVVPRATSGWWFVVPLIVIGVGLGLLVSQLNNYTLAPISDERSSEAAGVNSAGGSFGLSFGLAFAGAIMLATLTVAFTRMADSSEVLTPTESAQVASTLNTDAEVMSNAKLAGLFVDQPPDVQAEIIRINTDARPLALQVALLVPLSAAVLGVITAMRMKRLPDPEPMGSTEGSVLG